LRHIGDEERRARIARRHGIDPARRCADLVDATRAMTVLHATEPPTVHLALCARVDGLATADVDRALHDERSLVKQLAMRRTLFVFPPDLLPAAWGSASARVAETQRKRVSKDVEAAGLADDGEGWLKTAGDAVLARLADGAATTLELRQDVPELAGTVTIGAGTKWGGEVSLGPRVLTVLGARGDIVRGRNTGHWRLSRPEWTLMSHWLDDVPAALSAREGYAEIVRRYLWTFGPVTTLDLQWWLGSTKAAALQALADLDAVQVSVSSGPAWLLPDDVEPIAPVAPWAALLPILDPTVMGWKERGFFLGSNGPQLFDRNGNAGTTAWWGGQVVGCHVQDEDGVVRLRLLEDVGAEGRAALQREADRLTGWLGGLRVSTVYPSPLMRA
jgi:hypothetical protein